MYYSWLFRSIFIYTTNITNEEKQKEIGGTITWTLKLVESSWDSGQISVILIEPISDALEYIIHVV